jgi:hypothetical protein
VGVEELGLGWSRASVPGQTVSRRSIGFHFVFVQEKEGSGCVCGLGLKREGTREKERDGLMSF